MRDDDVRALFQRIGDGPQLGIDPREVASRGHRIRRRRRRLAIGVSTVAAAGITVLVGLSLGGAHRPPQDVGPARPPLTTTSTPRLEIPGHPPVAPRSGEPPSQPQPPSRPTSS
jgi:hypothetical protein